MPKSLLALGSLGCYGILKPLPKLFSSRKHRQHLPELCSLDCMDLFAPRNQQHISPAAQVFIFPKSSAFALALLSEPEMRLKEGCKGGKAAHLKSCREMAVRQSVCSGERGTDTKMVTAQGIKLKVT